MCGRAGELCLRRWTAPRSGALRRAHGTRVTHGGRACSAVGCGLRHDPSVQMCMNVRDVFTCSRVLSRRAESYVAEIEERWDTLM